MKRPFKAWQKFRICEKYWWICLDISIRLQTSKTKLKEELDNSNVSKRNNISNTQSSVSNQEEKNNSIENKANHMDMQISTRDGWWITENNKIPLENK